MNEDELREIFESQNRDSWGFKRSRRGSYINPVIQRDWKWFKNGAAALMTCMRTKSSGTTNKVKLDAEHG